MRYFIENRITAFMLFAGLFIFGLIGLSRLPVSLMPPSVHPGVSVIVEYPGMAPEKIETIITRPVEKIVKTVEGIQKIESVSEEGRARINVTFGMEADVRIASLHLREKIALIRGGFPRAVQEPMVLRYDPSDRPVLIATVELAGRSLPETREFAENSLKPRLQRIEGVSEITVVGGLRSEVHINADHGALAARSLSLGELSASIDGSNVSLSGGLVPCGGREYLVTIPYRITDIAQIADVALPPSRAGGALIRIGDVAEVVASFREREDISRLDGGEKVALYVQKAGGANTLEVCARALEVLAAEKTAKTAIVYDQGRFIRAALDNVVSSCLWGMGIVVMVIYVFFRRPGTVFAIALSIPFSVIAVFACMYFAGIDLNVMSLGGLALGGGVVVDNCIILTESILSRGEMSRRTICEGALDIRKAVISSTITTVIVFLPVVFGDKETGMMYGGMAFTISAALLVSLAVALVLVPAVYAAALESSFSVPPLPPRLGGALRSAGARLLRAADLLEARLVRAYTVLIDRSFANIRALFTYLVLLCVLSLVLYTFIKSDVIDPGDSGDFYVYLEFPTGTTLGRTDGLVAEAERRLMDMGVAEKITARVEKWRGTLTVSFKKTIQGSGRDKARAAIKKDLNELLRPHGAFAFISGADEISARELGIAIIGDDNETLRSIARAAAGAIGAVPGVEECVLRFREGKPAYTLRLDRAKAGASGVDARALADFFHGALHGPVITRLLAGDRELDVRARFREDQRRSIDEVLKYSLPNDRGELVPARELVTLKETVEPAKIWRRNGRRCVYVTARIGALSYEEAGRKIAAALKAVPFPPEYGYEYDDTVARLKEAKRGMIVLVTLSIVFVYMVLAVLFESLILPLVIMSTVPLAGVGVVPALFITGTPFCVPVYIGLIILVGIVVNNGIVLVDAMRSNPGGAVGGRDDLIRHIKAQSSGRLRPVVSTALTTIMGLFPALINAGEGAGLWRPLALTVISGLSFATVLTLVVVPVICYTLYEHNFSGKERS